MSAELFLENLPLIDDIVRFVCRRNHLHGPEAEDFSSAVKLKLLEDDYAVLRKFSGTTSLRAYLAVVIHRWLLDDRIARWGKWRPSAEARRRGELALRLETLLYRDGLSVEAASRRLIDEEKWPTDRGQIEELRLALPVRCRAREVAGSGDFSDWPAPDSARADQGMERREAQRAFDDAVARMRTVIERLNVEDRAILRLRFDQGLTVQQLAPLLSLDAKPLYRRIERLLTTLRRELESQGVRAQDLLPALGSVWFERTAAMARAAPAPSASDAPAARNLARRPSMESEPRARPRPES
jgi:RNA polymerase sigma factor (sigma-70 family)